MKKILALGFLSLGIMAAQAAPAPASPLPPETWQWSLVGNSIEAHGTFTTFAGAESGFESVTSFSGEQNEQVVVGLVPRGTDSRFIYDNMFTTATPSLFTNGGVVFKTAVDFFNLYTKGGQVFEYSLPSGSDVQVSFTAQLVSEPETYAIFVAGLGLLVIMGIKKSFHKNTQDIASA